MKANKKIIGAAGLAAILVVGGSFAYFNQTMTVNNPFDTGKYDTNVTEDFNPSDGENWEPGATVNKDVEVSNTGKYDVLVRVKFDEKWVNKADDSIVKENKGMDLTTFQDNATDGLTEADKSVVKKTLANSDKWVYNSGDGYWYYKSNLAAGASTGTFLDAVTLLEDADMGNYITTNYYTEAETAPAKTEIGESAADATTKWVAYTGNVPATAKHNMVITSQDSTKPGYGNANYTLTVTTQTIQATKAAVSSAFNNVDASALGCNWTLQDDTHTATN